MIPVLDKGYVILKDKLGTDETVVNAARVSFNKKTEKLNEKDIKLLNFLAEHEHTAPFRHAMLQFEVSAPLMVARQWFKHCIGSGFQDPMMGWNEISHRYVAEAEEFYIPTQNEWRKSPASKKQGSEGNFEPNIGKAFTDLLNLHILKSQELYEHCLKQGVAPEQARLFLPAYGLYIKFYWTCSLQAALHFLDLRLDSHAQYEIREYAKAVETYVKESFPESYKAWMSAKNGMET